MSLGGGALIQSRVAELPRIIAGVEVPALEFWEQVAEKTCWTSCILEGGLWLPWLIRVESKL